MLFRSLEGDFTHPSSLENAVRYNEVFPGVDVQYTAQELMVKEDIILNAPSEHSTFRYLLDAPGLDARMIDGVPVSYTHLEVYKRQIRRRRTARSWRSFCIFRIRSFRMSRILKRDAAC